MKNSMVVVSGLFVVALAGPALAQSEPGALSGPSAADAAPVADPDKSREVQPNDSFGTTDRSVLWIPMAAFQPRAGASTWTFHSGGYVSHATGTELLWAPLTIPNGSKIDTVRAWIYDNSAEAITVYLTEYGGITDSGNTIALASSVGTGETSIAVMPAYTVDNSSNFYVVYLWMPIDANLRVKGVRVLWYRQISAAPASATFSDVPTNHGFFTYVEALAASGITAGCGTGIFCPDTPLTRGQMAVFLSKALGLHHPF
jgi:hypothetical protein